MHPNKKPSPNINVFSWYGSQKKKSKDLNCPHCPSHLNIKYTYTNEYTEATDGTKSRKISCARCKSDGWICESCESNYVYNNMVSVRRHNRRYHYKVVEKTNIESEDEMSTNEGTIDKIANDGFFHNLDEEENWISFNNNLSHLPKEDRRFTTAIHENNADKYLVAYSQDKGHVDEDKLNTLADKEVTVMLDITKLASTLKPKENQLFMKIVKGIKEIEETRASDDVEDSTRITIPDNVSELNRYCTKNTYSILKNIPTPKCVNYGHIVNVSADEPVRYALLIGSSIAMLDPDNIENDISRMSKNMIGHRKGLRKKLIELAAKIRNTKGYKEGTKKVIVCFAEFRDDFNPYNGNNVNNSITLHTLSLVPIDSTVDSNEFTYPVAIGHKHMDNMLIETHYNTTLNEMMDPNNNKLFYSKVLKQFISVVLYPCGFMADQPGKRYYSNHAGGNSDYGGVWGHSCNTKDLYDKLTSCEECRMHLKLGADTQECSKCLNWNFLNGWYSKECVKENLGTAARPFKLTMDMQEKKGKEIYRDIVHGSLNKTDALKKLKPYNFTGDAKNLIISSAFAKKEALEDCNNNDTENDYPSFAIRQRNNFCYSSFTGSPMHLLALGLVSTVMSIVFQAASLFDVKKDFIASVKSTMEALASSKIDFAPIEALSTDKTTGWIGSDFIRTCKFIVHIFRLLDILIAKKNNNRTNVKNYTPTMCKNYLLLRNIDVPKTIKEKREAVMKHMQSMKNEFNDFNKTSLQPLVISIYKLVAHIMTAKDSAESKLRIHYKQYLNSFHDIDMLIKKLTNDKSESNKIVSMYNNLNVGDIINDTDNTGPVRFTWEANWHGEKGIQAVKDLFVSQKGNFGEILINKLYANKVLDYLSPEENVESDVGSKLRNYVIDSKDALNASLKNAVPLPFIMTKDGVLLFVFQHSDAVEFKFTDLVEVQMGWFYFNIAFLRSVENPLLKNEHVNTAIKCALLPSISCSNKLCYTAVSDDWLTLNEHGNFEVYSNLNLEIKHPDN